MRPVSIAVHTGPSRLSAARALALRLAGWATLMVLAFAAPLSAQNIRTARITPTPQTQVASPATSLAPDYQAMYTKEVEKNRTLRAEVDVARQQLADMTRPGGSRVMAYCEANTTSINTAGARSDCSAAGYVCEDVSGLCRTSCQTSNMCSSGFVCDTGAQQCVRP